MIRVVDIAANAEVSANNINIRAIVSDPKSFAINNKGVIRATGIDTCNARRYSISGYWR